MLPEDKRRLHELEEQVIELERGNPNMNYYDVNMGLDDMSNRLVELESLVNNEPKSGSRRDDFRRRVTHMKTTFIHIKNNFLMLTKKNNINMTLQGQRHQLFQGSTIGK
jgi:hypothetical protein